MNTLYILKLCNVVNWSHLNKAGKNAILFASDSEAKYLLLKT